MFKFRGFRASLNFSGGKKQDAYEYSYASQNVSTVGAYRTNREEFFGNGTLSYERKQITPAMIKLPPSFDREPLRQAKSTSNLTQNVPENLTKSTPDVSMNPRGAPESEQTKKASKQKTDKQKLEQQKQLEKQRAAEQKKREKEAALEMKRIEKENKKKKTKAPKTPSTTAGNIPPPPPMPTQANPLAQNKNNKANRDSTLLSRTSGPPPYDEVPDKLEVLPNTRDNGNTSFSKPDDTTSSWDLVSQHREQMQMPTAPERRQKKMVMDLNYNVNIPKDNSEA